MGGPLIGHRRTQLSWNGESDLARMMMRGQGRSGPLEIIGLIMLFGAQLVCNSASDARFLEILDRY